MGLYEAVTSLLRTYGGVSLRVFPSSEKVPVYTDLPKVLWTDLGGDRRYSDNGNAGLHSASFQLDVFAEKATTAATVLAAVRGTPESAGMDNYRGTLQGTTILRIWFPAREQFSEVTVKVDGQDRVVSRLIQRMMIEFRE